MTNPSLMTIEGLNQDHMDAIRAALEALVKAPTAYAYCENKTCGETELCEQCLCAEAELMSREAAFGVIEKIRDLS